MQNSILTNIASLKIRNNIDFANNKLSTTLKRMGSGYKVLNAKDDAAGCVIASKTNAKLSGLNAVSENVQRGMAFLNTAEDAYDEISNILKRLRDLSLEAANDTYDSEARQAIQDEADELTKELKRIQSSTKFGDINLFNNWQEQTTAQSNNGASPIALTSLDESTPVMMKSARAVQEYSVSFNAGETKTLNINGIDYTISSYINQNLVYKINDDNIEFVCHDLQIEGDVNKAHNVVLNGGGIKFLGGNSSDSVTINGRYCDVSTYAGQDVVVVRRNVDHGIINLGDDDDVFDAGALNVRNLTILGGDGANKTINAIDFQRCYLQGFEENENIQYLELAYEEKKEVIIGGKKYTIQNTVGYTDNGNNAISWKYDEETNKVVFAGKNSIIRGEANVEHNMELYGVALRFYGGEQDDTINLISGNGLRAYGNGGNDTLICEDGNLICSLEGGAGNDTVIINSLLSANASYIQSGGSGNDTYEINTSTTIEDNEGNNTYYINKDDVKLTTGTSNDTFHINADNVEVNTTGGDNKFIINGSNNKITSADGNDTFEIVGNNNQIDGGAGENKVKSEGNNQYQNISELSVKKPLHAIFQVGSEAGQDIDIELDFNLSGFNLDFSSSQGAKNNISKIDNLIDKVSAELSDIGANMNRLESIQELQNIEIANLSQVKSLIMDTDIAHEAISHTQAQIMQEFSISLFSQSTQLNTSLVQSLLNGIKTFN